jgi:uncharacterized protein
MRRLVALTAAGHVVFFAALVAAGLPSVAAFAVALGSVAMFVRRANVYLRGERRSRLAVALVDLPYFIHWTAGFIALPLALVALLLLPAKVAFVSAYLVALAIAAWGALVRRRVLTIDRVEVAIAGLDPRLDGYRIAHLSDLHIGPWTPRAWGLGWAHAANALGCDLAVVTGDLIAAGTEFHADAADVVGALRAKDGVLVAMGNHDYDHAGGGDALVALVESRGARVLRNEGLALRRDDALFVTAIDDRASRRADLDRALLHRPCGAATVMLAHDPADFDGAAARGVDLVLAGHTHGGQIAMPLAARHVNLGRISHRRTLGFYREGRSALVVHPGLGTSGPPVRVGVAPAILEITLRAA